MLRNYLKIAFRNLIKNKTYSFINLFGLTTGLACFLLVALYIFDELTYDAFHKDADRIYRLVDHKVSASGTESYVAVAPPAVSTLAQKHFPAVEDATRAITLGRATLKISETNQSFYEDYSIADAAFFKVFDFPFVAGNRTTALEAPYTAVVTDATAIKLFGKKDVVGKTFLTDRNAQPITITAVIQVPGNSHLQFNLVISEATVRATSEDYRNQLNSDWTSNSFITYFKLKPGQQAGNTAAAVSRMVQSHRAANQTGQRNFILQPLKNIHFHSAGIEMSMQSGNLMHVYVFALIGIFVLLIACINYMNLTTALFSTRSKEIAVRKVAGAAQQNLVAQFMTEALVLTVMAQLLALLAVKLVLPIFNAFTEKGMTLGLQTDYRIWLGTLCIIILVGLLAGSYPAFFQARLKPYLLLKNKIQIGKGHLSLRRVLVVFQFALSIMMIMATLVVYLQLKYINQKDLGFNKEQLVVIDINSGLVRRSAESIQNKYAKLAAVSDVCVTSRVPGEWKRLPKVKVTQQAQAEGDELFYIAADEHFLNTYSIGLQAGRNFLPNSSGDSTAVLINETAARMLGIHQPAGQSLIMPAVRFTGNTNILDNPIHVEVIGIVKDFNFQSLREKVAPMVIGYKTNPIHNIDYFTVRIRANDMSATVRQLETILHETDPRHLFEYNFLDKQWELFYREDQKRQVIFLTIASITILVASLGLLGLVTFAARQKTKEIGIRKVLGASVSHIVFLLSKDFLKLVLVAAFVAAPIAGWLMYKWLQDFAYRIDISVWIFIIPAVFAILMALVTLSFQTLRAAVANPVKSLRAE